MFIKLHRNRMTTNQIREKCILTVKHNLVRFNSQEGRVETVLFLVSTIRKSGYYKQNKYKKALKGGKKKADKLGTLGMGNDVVMDFLFASSVSDL